MNANPLSLMEKEVSISCDGKAIASSSANMKAGRVFFTVEEKRQQASSSKGKQISQRSVFKYSNTVNTKLNEIYSFYALR